MSVFNRQSVATRNIAAAFMSDLGAGMHPRVSISGGQFALRDASGERYGAPVILKNTPQGQKLVMLAIIIGSNPKKSRVYYDRPYDSNDPAPPTCFSDNGVAPSMNAAEPQARTCGECVFQRWGSDVSQASGKKTKACSEKKKIAVLVVGDTAGHVYELQIPPTTLKNMATYGAQVSGFSLPGASRKADLCDVVTEISFVPGQTGQLEFAPHCLLDACAVNEDGAILIQYNQMQRPLAAADGGESVGALIDEIWDSDELDEILGVKDQPFTPPAGFLAPGMNPTGFLGAPPVQATQGPVHRGVEDQRNLPGATAPAATPYSPPPGSPSAQPQTLPQAVAAPAQTVPASAQAPAPPTTRRVRKPRTEAAAPPQTQQAAPQLAAPAATAGGPGADPMEVPAFLRRQPTTPAPTTNGATQSFGAASPAPPPNSMEAALATAFSLPTRT